MTSRQRAYQFYLNRGKLEKAAASASQIGFRGASTNYTVLVRSDLNGYSRWVKDVDIPARVGLLDDFFSHAAVQAHECHGVYYRDEGDCIVTLFSDYFANGAGFADILRYAKLVSGRTYGVAALSCKTVVAGGDVTYYQKGAESIEGDWSAEGDPFITAVRIESAIDSDPSIYFLAEQYDAQFVTAAASQSAASGARYFWEIERRSLQVQGLQATGGWKDFVVYNHIPQGKLQA